MRGNYFQSVIGVTGFGESHGMVIGVLLEDIIPCVRFPLEEIQSELDKRRPGKDKYTSTRREKDQIQILSGVSNGITTGMPICLVVYNKDQRSEDYNALENIFRPGHADYSWYKKFKIFDWRGGGRASGRETIARVAAGAFVKELIKDIKIQIYPVQIGNIKVTKIEEDFPNPLSWHDRATYDSVLQILQDAEAEGDSLGGIIEIRIENVPAGLGDPVFEKLDAKLAGALISIGGIKGIEFGSGFLSAAMKGSEHNDQMNASGFLSNHSGGILGGVSNGEPIVMKLAVKPVSSIKKSQKTIDVNGNEKVISREGRHDTTLIIRIMPVIKAMIRLVLADCLSYQNLIKSKNNELVNYREAIDKLDEDILISLRKRQEIAKLIGKWKKMNDVSVTDAKREEELIRNLKRKADLLLLDSEFVEEIWKLIISESKKLQ